MQGRVYPILHGVNGYSNPALTRVREQAKWQYPILQGLVGAIRERQDARSLTMIRKGFLLSEFFATICRTLFL
jgi:hypothetical protein